ncbi:MAG TPA: energy-coupling factor ABC transporter permease, partial [Bryobacteraceae bacterium]|nr:energy-coupling factor ABC transporter permease [Bryobacteraceae bacterium]
MHIPDGFLSVPVWATLNAISLPGIGLAARRVGNEDAHSKGPLTGVLGAFVFAAQMINIPVAPGASAHLLGGALLGATLGPAAGAVVMTAVLAVQALLFQDGGLLALGANVFNLAIAGVVCGWLPWALLGRRSPSIAAFLGGVLSVLASSALALVELIASGVPIPRPLVILSFSLFGASAVLEGAITAGVISALTRMNPGWIRHGR